MKQMLTTSALLFFSACANHQSGIAANDTVELDQLDEFNRTNACVQGNLPMEVQFHLDENPHRLNGSVFRRDDIARIAKQIDVLTAGLLEATMKASALRSKINLDVLDRSAIRKLAFDFWFELATHAPERLQISYCGDAHSVGSQAQVSLVNYFERACANKSGDPPLWTTTAGRIPEKCGYLVMFAVALESSGYKVDGDMLLDELLKPNSPP